MSRALTRPTPTRRPLWFKTWRLVRICELRYRISADEAWLKSCAEDGILNSLSIRQCREQIQALRVELLHWRNA